MNMFFGILGLLVTIAALFIALILAMLQLIGPCLAIMAMAGISVWLTNECLTAASFE